MMLSGYGLWNKIAKSEKVKDFILNVKKKYEKDFNRSVCTLPYSCFKRIAIDGERKEYESYYFERRERLLLLQILSLYDEKYLSDLEDLLAVILEEFTWVLPAHCYTKNGFDYTVIDLVSAETGAFLAETAYMLKDRLSEDIYNRIKESVKTKIVDNYSKRQFLFDNCTHNWASVCSGGVGKAYLYLYPELFDGVKDRVFNAMKNYLNGIGDDGVSSEGIIYWEYGFGSLCSFFDVYTRLKGDYPEILNCEKIKKTLEYFENANLGGNVYLPFADGGQKKVDFIPTLIYPIKNLFGDKFTLPNLNVNSLNYPLYRVSGFTILQGLYEHGDSGDQKIKESSVYYSSAQVFIRKTEKYSFVAKCGNNSEHHNHNDVGVFQLVKDGKRIIADLGAGEYTWAYHNDHTETGRYGKEIFVCGSWSHSVPIVDGRPQVMGTQYQGDVISVSDTDISMEISKAYDTQTQSILVEYKTQNDKVIVKYSVQGVKESITFRFVSDYCPLVKNVVDIEGVRISNSKSLMPIISKVDYLGMQRKKENIENKQTAYTIDYTITGKNNFEIEFAFDI